MQKDLFDDEFSKDFEGMSAEDLFGEQPPKKEADGTDGESLSGDPEIAEKTISSDTEDARRSAYEKEVGWRKKWSELEAKLHTTDFSKRVQKRISMNAFTEEVLSRIAEDLGESPSAVLDHAVMLFYQSFFMLERNRLADVQLAVEALSLTADQAVQEARRIANLTLAALEAEKHPSHKLYPDV